MINRWYFECLDHNPPIRSEVEFASDAGIEFLRSGVEMANRRPINIEAEAKREISGLSAIYYNKWAMEFLVSHPHCNLGIVSRRGERRPLSDFSG